MVINIGTIINIGTVINIGMTRNIDTIINIATDIKENRNEYQHLESIRVGTDL